MKLILSYFQMGTFSTVGWGGGGHGIPIVDPHGAVQLGCSEPAVIAVPFNPLSIWEGALISPRSHPAQTRSKPFAYSKAGECKSQTLSPSKRIEWCVLGSLAGHPSGMQVASL